MPEASVALAPAGVSLAEAATLPVRGWGDQVPERGIVAKPVFVFQVLGRTEWLEQLAGMVATGEIGLRAVVPFQASDAAEAQRALTAGAVLGRPVIVFD